ncbi:MAG TPA: endo alpha-1,4 polygalactosaminidase [Pseudomonadota bacterium]|nr:endo alpha-1,4 polygalactosaminidase [Pseudomonadota bacterium]
MPALRTVKTTDVEMVSSGGRSALRGALSLTLFAGTLFAGTLAACGNPEIDSETDALEAVAIEPSAAAAQSRLFPTRLTLQSGKVSAQPLTVLATQDQSGTVDTWVNYLEFSPGTAVQATFTFTLPSSVTPAQLASLTLLTNYKGQAKATQTWSFQLYDVANARWVTVGDNQAAKSWVWSPLAFVPTGTAANFVSASRELSLRLVTKSAADNCDLDYLALSYTTGSAQSPTPTPTGLWVPRPGTSWQIQFAGTLDTSVNVKAFDLDLFGTSKATIDQLHAKGTKVICYFSGGSSETYRPDFGSFPPSVLGTTLGGYPDERWLDVRQLAILGPIMTARMDLAKEKGCDAVDADNMDGYTNNSGFSISYAQQLAYNKLIADEAHKRGMSIGLKNDLLQIKDLADTYDFAINEQCLEYSECSYMKPFIDRNKAVFAISYSGSQSSVCSQSNPLDFDMLIKNLSLDSYRVTCR